LKQTTSVHFANPQILDDWTQNKATSTILQYISYYLAVHDIPGDTVTIDNRPSALSNGQLSFNFSTDGDESVHIATVQVQNYSGILSTAVFIDGNKQTYTIADTLYNASFSGFDALADNGLSGMQVYGIQRLLVDHWGHNSDFEAGKVTQSIGPDGTLTTFPVTINHATYTLQNTSSGLTDITVRITDNKGDSILKTNTINMAV